MAKCSHAGWHQLAFLVGWLETNLRIFASEIRQYHDSRRSLDCSDIATCDEGKYIQLNWKGSIRGLRQGWPQKNVPLLTRYIKGVRVDAGSVHTPGYSSIRSA